MSGQHSKESQDGVKGGDGMAVIVCESESEKGLAALGMDQEWMAVVVCESESEKGLVVLTGKDQEPGKEGLPLRLELTVWGKEPMATSILAGRGIGPPMWTDQGVEISGMIDSRLGRKYFSAEGGIGEEERMKLVVPWEFS
ncbi:hypothetical protein BDR07DRAFT_1378374 [Suillus spraguei]|nr:hypothetical protein BDR07DRAFT_1378374 [Suillus spraguei]